MNRTRMRRSRTAALLLTAALAVGLTPALLAPTSAQAAVAFSTAVINQNNGNCADVPNGAGTNALQLVQWTCNSGTNQNFSFTAVAGTPNTYTIATLTNGSCLDIAGASNADNAAVIQYTCHTATNQQFRLQAVPVSGATNTFNVVSVASGKCVAPTGDASTTNTTLVQLPCTTSTSRTWRLPNYTNTPGPTPTVTPTATPTTGPPPTKTVRVFWVKPSDVPYEQAYPDGIAGVMRESQRYYKQELGKTFTLNQTVVEVVNGDHVRSWYENTPNGGEKYWWSVFNMADEIRRKYGVRDGDPRWLIVGEISAEGEGAGGGGGNGWVIL